MVSKGAGPSALPVLSGSMMTRSSETFVTASTVSPLPTGGARYWVTGSATAKNIRSVPMPAANNIAAQEKTLNSGSECSGPSFVLPYLESARKTTNARKAVAIRI